MMDPADFDRRADDMADFDEARAEMAYEKNDYDAVMDAAYEYEASVIEKGIRDQVDGRARDYLARHGDAVWRRIEQAILESESLLDEHPGASLVLTMTAIELLVRLAIKGFGGRDRELLPHLSRLWDIDLPAMRLGDGGELLSALGILSTTRDRAVHRGEPVTVADARLAIDCFAALGGKDVLGELVIRLGMNWPEEKWLMPFDAPEDPLASR